MKGAEAFDADDPDHMKWVFDRALERAQQFGIPGVTLSHTQAPAHRPAHPASAADPVR